MIIGDLLANSLEVMKADVLLVMVVVGSVTVKCIRLR